MQPTTEIRWENAARVIEPGVTPSGIHQCRFDPNLPMQVRFLRLQPPASVRPRHHEYLEVLYLASGSAVYHVGNKDVLVREGDLLIPGRNLYHGIQQYLTPAIRAVALYFDPFIILGESSGLDSAEYLTPFGVHDGDLPCVVPARSGIPAQVKDLIQRIHRESSSRTLHSQLAMKTCLKMVLVLLLQHYASDSIGQGTIAQRNRNLTRLEPLLDYIDKHFAENISVDQAARLVAMSKSHFMRYFRAVTSEVFISYLNRFRINKAQQMLAGTDRSIAAISQEVGFCDQSYFGVLFRRFVGTTPREYRESCSLAARSDFRKLGH